jgi:anti-anti-sigma regulatory factor
MFRIQRSVDGKFVVFTLSGRIKEARLAELQKLLEFEASDHNLVLDLKEVKLVDRDVVRFLANCESKGVNIANCPAYIREWIEKEAAHRRVLKMSKGF